MASRQIPAEVYGTEVPASLASRLHRWRVTPSELSDLIAVVGHHWPAIEAHVSDRRYQSYTSLPGRLCDRWCPVGGDPVLVAAGVTGAQPDEPVTQAGRPASGGAG